MRGGRFQVALEPLNEPASHGLDGIELMVSVNPGQPMRPLTRVASGGELSRIGLAIQVLTADSARIPTLIFDEVDAGIGGAVAEIVGRRLRQVARSRQVLCVTHLAQVAAQAHHHLQVDKHSGGDRTKTSVRPLDRELRVTEIARMLGGVRLTARSLAHAREMIIQAAKDEALP
jgi:DNA repair protein RecN (Recombination protein N)